MPCTQIFTYVYPLNSIVRIHQPPDPGEAAWVNHFNVLRPFPSTYYSLVIVDKQTDKIMGLYTVYMERMFQRGQSCVGYTEDIAVDEKQRGEEARASDYSGADVYQREQRARTRPF